ncbi:hypothetical protein PFISCL1PPCAC_21661, partial [Pristionchus fissidentatus]
LLRGSKIHNFSLQYKKLCLAENHYILNYARIYEIKNIEIEVLDADSINPRIFLLELAHLVDAIELRQLASKHNSYWDSYCVGLRDENWTALIAKMF